MGVGKASAHKARREAGAIVHAQDAPNTVWSLPERQVPHGLEAGDLPLGEPFLSRRSSHKDVRLDVHLDLATHQRGITFTDT